MPQTAELRQHRPPAEDGPWLANSRVPDDPAGRTGAPAPADRRLLWVTAATVTGVSIACIWLILWSVAPGAILFLFAPAALLGVALRGRANSRRERDLLHSMGHEAELIADRGDLKQRVELRGGVDAVAFARSLNRLLDLTAASVDRERRFVREVSDELQLPIALCYEQLEALEDAASLEAAEAARAALADELGRMEETVHDLTTLAIAEDPAFLRPQPVALESFVREVEANAALLLADRVDVGHVPASIVHADPDRLAQALLDLLQNAAHNTPAGTRIRLDVEQEPKACRFEVWAHGGALPPGNEDVVFQPFDRGSTGSAGLGLALVRAVAEAHGGEAGVENHPGDGVTFWLEIPA